MAVLEIGINLGVKPLLERKYYKSSDKVLDPKTRARFLSGLQSYLSEIYNDKINVISFANFQIVCYYKTFQVLEKSSREPHPLMIYAIIEKGIDPNQLTNLLKEILSQFIDHYYLDDIIAKDSSFFKSFEADIDKLLGDLKFKLEDRLKGIFGKKS